ncbi:MAG: GNAT family N-acetyltransferase [Thermonemataceae bacterium]
MNIEKVPELDNHQKTTIISIWNAVYPNFLNYGHVRDFNVYLSKLSATEHFLVFSEKELVGWAAKFERNNDKWFVILVESNNQHSGIGTHLMDKIKENEKKLSGWVIDNDQYIKANGEPYLSPLKFYKKTGFEVTSERLNDDNFTAVKVEWKS